MPSGNVPRDKPTERRFEVELDISLRVHELVGADRTLFFKGNQALEYPNMGYDGPVAIEAAINGLNEALNGFGFDAAIGMGLGDKLKAMGLEKKS